GVYAAMLREQGRPLDYPGGAARVSQAVDVDLLARAIGWAGEAAAARNEAFNVTNGDVFTWENVWPAIAEALEMKPGNAVPLTLGVSDMERSRKFYDQALRPLGIERLYAEGETASGYGAGRKAFFWISLRAASQTGSHVAFTAEDRQTVDRFHQAALSAGGRDN